MSGNYPWHKDEYGETKTWVLVIPIVTAIIALIFFVAWTDAKTDKANCDRLMSYTQTHADTLKVQFYCVEHQ